MSRPKDFDDVLEVCRFIKDKYNKTIRINTNGLADLIHKKNTAPMFDGLIDIVSISLNTPNKERYLELTRSKFGIESFDAMIKFAEKCKALCKGSCAFDCFDNAYRGRRKGMCRYL